MGTKKAKGAEQRSRSQGEGGNGGALKAQGRGSRPSLVIVESPAKARKIGGFLGKNYSVMASMGHVRDLPANASEVPEEIKKQKKPWASLGVDVEHDFEPVYVIPKDKRKTVTQLKAALKDASELILATDEDREGESIGWHLSQLLKPKVPVKRMVFSEITKEAIQHAIQQTRALDEKLVEAQETRRVLDRLYGYTLSPLLWKKIARGLSAGRVQSVAVRLLVQRELERMAFHSGDVLGSQGATGHPATGIVGGCGRRAGVRGDARSCRRTPRCDGQGFRRIDGQAEARCGRGPAVRVGFNARSADRAAAGPWKVTDVEQRPQVAAPVAAVHHQHAAARGQPQTGLQRQRHDAHRAASLRGRLHHVHAY